MPAYGLDSIGENVVWYGPGVESSENICLRGERMSSDDVGIGRANSWMTWEEATSSGLTKMASKFSKKSKINESGTLRLGENTMATADISGELNQDAIQVTYHCVQSSC